MEERGEAKENAEKRVNEEGRNANQEDAQEILRPLVVYVAHGIAESQEADVEHRNAAKPAKQHVGGLMHDDTRKGEYRDQPTRDNEHCSSPHESPSTGRPDYPGFTFRRYLIP